jgi:crotonobetainyl-CoA:carnitine CoA-transferase CaiB-like acyl-CoA transferase
MNKASGGGLLAGLRVVERSNGVAAAYAGRLLAAMGAEIVLVEEPGGSALRAEPPMLEASGQASDTSALFAYLAAAKRSVICPLATQAGQAALTGLLEGADILIDDTPVAERATLGLDPDVIRRRHPALVHVSVLPFGATGPKAGWRAYELNLIHAAGEGFLLPNGLSAELFPERPPLKIYGHFTSLQGGTAAALGALSALWARDAAGGQFVDISVQDAGLAVGAFAIQRLGDGQVEHRLERSFKYGGVLECRDGFVEVLTLEERQWAGMIELMGSPAWAADEQLANPILRSQRGREINAHIREWARGQGVVDVVRRAQQLGVPMARYNTPADVLEDAHERARGLFQKVEIGELGPRDMLVAPFHVDGAPLSLSGGPPALGAHQGLLAADPAPMAEMAQ